MIWIYTVKQLGRSTENNPYHTHIEIIFVKGAKMEKQQWLKKALYELGYAGSWLQGAVDRFDSYRSSYYLSALLVIILDIISAMRIRVVYLYYTHTFMAEWEIDAICAGLVIMNYLVATHRHFGLEAIYYRIEASQSNSFAKWLRKVLALGGVFLLVLITLAHDVAAVLWNFLFQAETSTISTALDARIVAGVVAGLVIVPFLIGHHMIAVKERMPEQDRKHFKERQDAIVRRMQLRALTQLERDMRDYTPQQILGQAFVDQIKKDAEIPMPTTQIRLVETKPRQIAEAPRFRPDVVTGQFAAIQPTEEETPLPKVEWDQ